MSHDRLDVVLTLTLWAILICGAVILLAVYAAVRFRTSFVVFFRFVTLTTAVASLRAATVHSLRIVAQTVEAKERFPIERLDFDGATE